MQLFYTRHISDGIAVLSEDEARHVKVLRKNVHDTLHLISGDGYLYEAEITAFSDTKKSSEVKLSITGRTLQVKPRSYYLHLHIAPTKQNERMEWMLEKAIETGLDEITFLQTDHSEKSRVNASRLEKIAISAMKQSGEYFMPRINDLIPFSEILKTDGASMRLLAHCNAGYEKSELRSIFESQDKKGHINIYIGPEGDFSENEIRAAYECGFKGLSLGPTRLRTETAGLYACMALSAL